jgi:hypothetical protein
MRASLKDWLKYYCALIILFMGPAHADENLTFYKIEDIHVDVTDSSAMQARTSAIIEAQRKALSSLAERLQITEGEKIVAELPDEKVELLVKDFAVTQEKTSNIRYIATFSVQFKPKAVQKFFNTRSSSSQNIAGKEAFSGSLVIIPVLVDGPEPLLWQETNAWFNAWNNQSSPDPSMILPLGDLADIKDLSAKSALAGDHEKITSLLTRYNSPKGLVAVVEKQENATPSYQLMLKAYSPGIGLVSSDTVFLEGTPKENASFWLKAIEKALGFAKNPQTLKENQGSIETLPLLVRFNSLEEWVEIQELINKTPLIKTISIEELSLNEAKSQLTYQSDLKTLQDHLKKQGLLLEEIKDREWQLSFNMNNKIQTLTSPLQNPLVSKNS